jgi:hypothetical protein
MGFFGVSFDGDDTVGSWDLELVVDVTRACHELSEGGLSKYGMIRAFVWDHLEVKTFRPKVVRRTEGDVKPDASQGFALSSGYHPVESDMTVCQLSL